MRVLMFGWEFPPFNSGGLGTACEGLTRGLLNQGVEVTFVLPKKVPLDVPYVKMVYGDETAHSLGITWKQYLINSLLQSYITSKAYEDKLKMDGAKHGMYGGSLFDEVQRFGMIAAEIAKMEKFDIIHAHDWLTYPAGIAAKKVSGKPLVVHIHNTVYDRGAGNANQQEYLVEKAGFENADLIIAVSNQTRQKVIEHYGISPSKVRVVHNSIDFENYTLEEVHKLKDNHNIVLYLGRLTVQKGVDYLISAARRVIDHVPETLFVIAGGGDMERQLIDQSAALGIADKVIFTGFLRGKDIKQAYQMADLCVMPSVSEPFGIVPLESVMHGAPALVSKQSGVSEVLNHCLKVDFWDVDEMTNKIVSVLQHHELKECLQENSYKEIQNWNWNVPASKCVSIYQEVLGGKW